MKRIILFFLIYLMFDTVVYCQHKIQSNNSISIEIIPWALFQTPGSGLNITYNRETSKAFNHAFSIGFLYNNFETGFERELYTLNGVPLAQWSTEVDIETKRPYPLNGVVNDNDFRNLDNLGIKQFKPKLGYRLNRAVAYELSYFIINKKLRLGAGIGTTLGMTDRDDTHVGFTGNITNNLTGQTERFWVNINIRARYLYLGFNSKISLDYPVSESIRVGVNLGLNYIFDKNFQEDIKIPLVGLTGKFNLK